ncbi:MAG: hypothetical protein JWQ96_1880 [Segetibacter sp.]|nr:hypothetical protein [Segetibacter sp.]
MCLGTIFWLLLAKTIPKTKAILARAAKNYGTNTKKVEALIVGFIQARFLFQKMNWSVINCYRPHFFISNFVIDFLKNVTKKKVSIQKIIPASVNSTGSEKIFVLKKLTHPSLIKVMQAANLFSEIIVGLFLCFSY